MGILRSVTKRHVRSVTVSVEKLYRLNMSLKDRIEFVFSTCPCNYALLQVPVFANNSMFFTANFFIHKKTASQPVRCT